MYIYEDSTIYNSSNGKYSMWINYADGSYTFNDFTGFDKNIEIQTGATKETIIMALSKIGIVIPDESIFEESNGNYVFNVSIKNEDKVIEGSLTCSYYNDDTIKRIENNIIEYAKVKEKEIIS